MRRGLIFLLIFIGLLAAPSLIRLAQFYQIGGGTAVQPPEYDPGEAVEVVPTPAAASFVDLPEVGDALILLDRAHENQFTLDDMRFLDGRLAARGVAVREYTGGDLRTQLRGVNAFIVIAPIREFTADEISAVADFVTRGGRLLLIGDPTRYNLLIQEDLFTFTVDIESDEIPLNSIANEFDIIFKGDYLYNTVRNEGNFRNIILEEESFGENPLTADITRLAFYGSHSLQVGPGGDALLRGDDDTWSSATDRPGGLVLGATSEDGRVLALGDINFLTEPYYTVFDNSQFIARIADFLAGTAQREYQLTDFPYFLRDAVDLVYLGDPDLGPDAFDEIITLQDRLRQADVELALAAEPGEDDLLYLGLFNQSDELADLLDEAGISLVIDPPILTEDEMEAAAEESAEESGETAVEEEEEVEEDETEEEPTPTLRLIQSELGNVQMSGTALFLFHDSGDQRQLIVLAASKEGLENSVDRLLNLIPLDAGYVLADCLLQGNLALCPTDIADEEVEAELLTGGEPVGMEEEEEEAEEEAAPEDEEEDGEEEETEPETEPEIDAANQGTIALDETVEATLAADERHAWTFADGPAVVDVVLTSGPDLDAVLELYNAENELLYSADSGFSGDDEAILDAEIPDDGEYTIVVRDFFDGGGEYALSVTFVSEISSGENGEEDSEGEPGEAFTIFIFEDDDGEPLSDGFTSTARLEELLLAAGYDVEVWTSSEDGPLPENINEEVEFLIWDSGDYQTNDGFLDEDVSILFEYLDAGKPIVITGSAPAVFGNFEPLPLADLEITGDDAVLLDGFTAGDIIVLDQTLDTVYSELLLEDVDEESMPFFLRGPESEESGSVVGIASNDTDLEQRSLILLMPFVSLPEDVQEQLLTNTLAWFELP